MTRTSTPARRGRHGLKTATRVGGLLVASSLLSGTALAKDEKRSKGASDQKSSMAVKTAPGNAMAVKTAPGSTMAVKTAPAKPVAVKTIRVNPAKGR